MSYNESRNGEIMKIIYMYIQNSMADWEHGYLMQALSLQSMLDNPQFVLKTVSKSKKVIQTASGLTIVPDLSLDEIDILNLSALILIGGDTWMEDEHSDILTLANSLIERNILVAAICGATLGLAEKGILDKRYHTSNAPFFLQQITKHYQGQNYYKEEIAVRDNKLTTASSAGSLLWAKFIIKELAIFLLIQLKHGLITFLQEKFIIITI